MGERYLYQKCPFLKDLSQEKGDNIYQRKQFGRYGLFCCRWTDL